MQFTHLTGTAVGSGHHLWRGEERGGGLNTWNPSFMQHQTLLLVSPTPSLEPGAVLEQSVQVKAGLHGASPQERHRKAAGCAFRL